MTEIVLVRHGETELNVGEVFRGKLDVELNETGMKQAQLVAEYLKDMKIQAVYSSPLKRALRTAQAIAGYHNLNAESTTGLIDLDFGEWQGLPRKAVKDKYPQLYARWVVHPELAEMPGGEGLEDVRLRVRALVDQLVEKYRGTVVLVSHRVILKVLICALLGLDNSHFWNIRVDTCGVTIFNHDYDSFVLARHNDTSFLRPLKMVPQADF